MRKNIGDFAVKRTFIKELVNVSAVYWMLRARSNPVMWHRAAERV